MGWPEVGRGGGGGGAVQTIDQAVSRRSMDMIKGRPNQRGRIDKDRTTKPKQTQPFFIRFLVLVVTEDRRMKSRTCVRHRRLEVVTVIDVGKSRTHDHHQHLEVVTVIDV